MSSRPRKAVEEGEIELLEGKWVKGGNNQKVDRCPADTGLLAAAVWEETFTECREMEGEHGQSLRDRNKG